MWNPIPKFIKPAMATKPVKSIINIWMDTECGITYANYY